MFGDKLKKIAKKKSNEKTDDKKIELEYLEFRNFDTFQKVDEISKNTLTAIAVKIGKTRLIDNIILR